jgi:putative transcriptional regulator
MGDSSLQSASLAPGLLLAAPRLGDPNFERSVVLLGHHDGEGALGWVLNGQALPPVGQILRDAGLVPDGVELPEADSYGSPARIAGPVMPGSAWLLFVKTPGSPVFPGELALGDNHAITGAREIIEAVARGEGPREFRLLLGYAGWGPGQLEGEIGEGAWLPASLDASLLFASDADELWDAAYQTTVGAHAFSFTTGPKGSA